MIVLYSRAAAARTGQIARRAQQHQAAPGLLMRQVRGLAQLAQLAQALVAAARQAVQAGPVGGMHRGAAGPPPAPQPDPLASAQRAGQPHRGMAAEQVAQHLGRHAGRRPGRDLSRCHHAGIGKAGFLGHAAPAIKRRDLVAVLGQLVGCRDAGDAGTDHGDAHALASPAWGQRQGVAQGGFNAERDAQHRVVAHRRAPDHQAHRHLAGSLAGQRQGAAVEHVDG